MSGGYTVAKHGSNFVYMVDLVKNWHKNFFVGIVVSICNMRPILSAIQDHKESRGILQNDYSHRFMIVEITGARVHHRSQLAELNSFDWRGDLGCPGQGCGANPCVQDAASSRVGLWKMRSILFFISHSLPPT